jgi:hypothetical protein
MENGLIYMIPIVSIVGSFAMVVAVVWLVTRARQRKAQYKAEVQMKMIDRFGTGQEFVNFLESPAGREFLEQPRRNTREKVIGTIMGGLVCVFVGLGFCGCALVFRDPGFLVPGFIILGAGIALLIGTAISWNMMKKLGPTS